MYSWTRSRLHGVAFCSCCVAPACLLSSINSWGHRYGLRPRLEECVCWGVPRLNKDSSWDGTDGYTNSHHEMGYWMHSSCDPLACTQISQTQILQKNHFGIKNQMSWIIKSYKKKNTLNSQQFFNASESWMCRQVTDLWISHVLLYLYQMLT